MSSHPDTKHCRGCDQHLPREAFARMGVAPDGLQYRCRACQKARWDALPPGVRHTYYKTHDDRYREQRREAAAQERSGLPDKARDRQYQSVYGLTLAEYEELLAAQGGACRICGGVNWNGRRLGIDHDHATGRVRGLLCNACNTALGYFKDDLDLIIKAYFYLSQSSVTD